MMKKIGIFVLSVILALTAGLVVACTRVKVDKKTDKQYTVTYYYNYDGAPNGGVYREDKVKEKTVAQKPAKPTRADYTFDKWTTAAAATSAEYTFTEKVTSDVKLYAQWTANAVVTFSGIEITTKPTKLTYVQGEELDLTGMVVTAKYSNNTTKVLKADEYTVTGYEKTKLGEQTVTVSYSQKAARFTVEVVAPEIDYVEITSEPTKKEYTEGENLDTTGLVVTAYYKNGTSAEVEGYTHSFKSDKLGEQTVTVTYNGMTSTNSFAVTVKAAVVISGLEVTTKPTKLTYEVGEPFDPAGMVVQLTYTDGTSKELKSGEYKYTGYDSTTAGTKTITVSYGDDLKATFTVTVRLATYTVEFKTNVEGIAAPTAKTVNKGDVVQEPTAANFQRDGYDFLGWFKGAETTAYIFTTPVTEGFTLTAKWKAIEYTVTYHLEGTVGGNAVVAKIDGKTEYSAKYTIESDDYALVTPTVETQGVHFVGWHKDSATGEALTTIVAGSFGNVDVYAEYTANTLVDFIFNHNYGETPKTEIQKVPSGLKATKPADPSRTGYTFYNWYEDAACTKPYDFDTVITTETTEIDRTVFAKWNARSIAVVFDPKNGEESFTVATDYNKAIVKPEDPELLGHSFDGWFRTNGDDWNFDKTLEEVLLSENKITLTLEAHWTVETYDVELVLDNGSDNVIISDVTFGTLIPTDYVPSGAEFKKLGHNFVGWFWTDADDVEHEWNFDTDTLQTEYLTLTAKWTPKTITVTFDVDGGTPAVANKGVTFGQKVTAPAAVTKVGHTFAGWYNGNTPWDFDNDTLQTESLTLTAKWTPNDVTVKFVDSDLTTVIYTQKIKYGEKATEPAKPKKTHYTFLHWHMLDGETVWDFDNTVKRVGADNTAGLLTLVAHWNAETYDVKFEMGDDATLNITPAATYTYNVLYTLPSADDVTVSKAGYHFGGWYDNAECSGTPWTNIPVGTYGEKTFYPYITENAQIEFVYNLNYGNQPDVKATVTQGTPKSDDYTPSRTGWTFTGWYTTSACDVKYNFDSEVMVKTTVYAGWEINKYTVKFYTNDGTSAYTQKVFTSEEKVTAPDPAPTRTGYTLTHWYVQDEAMAYVFGNNATANLELYAKWEANKYTVTFNSNGGTTVAARENITYNTVIPENLRPANPTKVGHTFAGWFKEVALTNQWNFATDVVTADITLYAKWDINSYTVSFDVNGGVGAVEAQTVEYGKKATKPTATVTKEGYHLKQGAEWTLEDGTVWSFAERNIEGDVKLYANWEINTYTVTFNSNGGTEVAAQPVTHGGKVSKPADPTREGWEFVRWNLGSGEYDFDTPVTDNITLSAFWSGKTGTYLYCSPDGETWSAAYKGEWVLNNYNQRQWKFAGVELYKGMQFIVVTYGNADGSTNDVWLHAAANIDQWTFNDVITVEPVKSNDDPNNNDYNFVVTEYDSSYNGAKWNVLIGNLDREEQSATISTGIEFSTYYDYELRDPSNSGKTPTTDTAPIASRDIYIRGTFTGTNFGLSKEWSSESTFIKVLKPIAQDDSTYTFRKVYLKKGDAFKVFITGNMNGNEDSKCWYGGTFTGLNEVITLSLDARNLYLGTIDNGYYDLIIDKNAYTIKIVKWAEATVATVTIDTPPTKVEYFVGQPFSFDGLVVKATNTDRETTTVTVTADMLSDTSTNVVGTKTITVTYQGKTASFDITVKELKVTFVTDGGTAVEAQSLSYGDKAVQPATSKTGYDFQGWYTVATCDCTETCTHRWSFTTTVTDTLTLYARWTIHEYDVKFYVNGEQLGETVKVPYNTAIPANKVPTVNVEGYKFEYWKNGGVEFKLTTAITANTDLVAELTRISYKVTLDNNGTITERTVYHGDKVTKPADSVTARAGYTFDGWFNNAVSTTETYNFDAPVKGELTLTAKWTVIEYTITYNVTANGTAPAQGKYTVEDAVTLATPTGITAGYTFIGWHEKEDLSDATVAEITKGSIGNRVFYAEITQNSAVTLTFNFNYGETPETRTASVVSGTAGKALSPAPTRTGYTFKGWYTTAECTTAYTFPIMEADDTVYALWQINTHTVKFNTFNGSKINDITVEYGAAITKPADPTYDEHTFDGWFKDNEFKTEWKFTGEDMDTMPDKDVVLYAKWTAITYTVTFMDGDTQFKKIENLTKNATISAPTPAPTKAGHDFVGWYTEQCDCEQAACAHAWNFTTGKVTADTVLYAKWNIQKFTVTFVSNGGTDVTAIENVPYDTTITKPANPTREGYTFPANGWCKDEALTEPWNFATDTVTGNIVLYANWTEIEYMVKYFVAIGDGDPTESTTTGNPAVYKISLGDVTLVKPEMEGYTFDGWYANSACTESVEKLVYDDLFKGANTLTAVPLYGRFTVNGVVVTFDLNYTGSVNPTVTVDWNTAVPTAKIPTPTRANHTFDGWYTDAACSANKAWDKTAKITTATTVYAKWKKDNGVYIDDVMAKALTGDANEVQAQTVKVPNNNSNVEVWYGNAKITGGDVKSNYFCNLYKGTGLKKGIYDFYYKPGTDDHGLWIEAYHIITLDANDGEVSGDSELVTYKADNTNGTAKLEAAPAAATRDGYEFLGWYTAMTGGSKVSAATEYSASVTLYARWAVNYTISYINLPAGATNTDNPTTYNISNGTVTIGKPNMPAGKAFLGWKLTDADGDSVTKITTANIATLANGTTTVTLYADWVDAHAVKFYYNYTGAPNDGIYATCSVLDGQTVSDEDMPEDPTRLGYKFLGWLKDGAAWSATAPITGNTDLYADWEESDTPMYTITFNNVDTEIKPQIVEQGEKVNKPTDPTKANWTFDGWYMDEACSWDKAYDFNKSVAYDIDLYARWIPNTVQKNSYYLVGDPKWADLQAQYYIGSTANFKGGFVRITFPATNMSGTSFRIVPSNDAGSGPTWTSEFGYTQITVGKTLCSAGPNDNNIKINANGTYIIVFTEDKQIEIYKADTVSIVDVTFDLNDGTDAAYVLPASTATGIMSLPSEPTREGYAFGGWFTTSDNNASTKVTVGTVFTANTTVYAKWQYTVEFVANGGTWDDNSTPHGRQVDQGGKTTAIDPPDNPPTGKVFDYWGDADGNEFNFATTAITGNITLYAQWKDAPTDEFTVTFKDDGATVETQTVAVNGTLTQPTRTKLGYTLDGWYNGSTKWNFATGQVTATMTLTAKWTADYYMVNGTTQTKLTKNGTEDEYMVTGVQLAANATISFRYGDTVYTLTLSDYAANVNTVSGRKSIKAMSAGYYGLYLQSPNNTAGTATIYSTYSPRNTTGTYDLYLRGTWGTGGENATWTSRLVASNININDALNLTFYIPNNTRFLVGLYTHGGGGEDSNRKYEITYTSSSVSNSILYDYSTTHWWTGDKGNKMFTFTLTAGTNSSIKFTTAQTRY